MSASGRSQGALHAVRRPTSTETRPESPLKRPRVDSPPGSEPDEEEPDDDRMDSQHAKNITLTQAIGDYSNDDDHELAQLPPPLSVEREALGADFEIITAAVMENLYNRITKNINKMTALAVEKATSPLHNRIVTMSARITQLQQQVLTCQDDVRRIRQIPFVAPASGKKEPKMKKEKQPARQANTNTNRNTNLTYAAVATAAATSIVPMATDTTGWTTLKVGSQKDKKILTSKLIPTTYP